MKNNFTIKLIEGSFAPSEAGKVLFSLLNSKINYHNLELFSAQERHNGNVAHSKNRIEYLKNVTEELSSFIKDALQDDLDFEIIANIEIKCLPKGL